MGRGYVIVEGHGEQDAVLNLLTRLWADLGLEPLIWAEPIRGKNLVQRSGVEKSCELIRRKADPEILIVLRDDEDGCPKVDGPAIARWLRELALPFPSAVVLAYREFESLFLPCVARMAGKPLVGHASVTRPGLRADARFNGDLEAKRGVKEWLSTQMPKGTSYKPAVDQLPLMRLVDFSVVRASGLPWFGTLERALRFVDAHRGQGAAYP
jgi:hypothetical protein